MKKRTLGLIGALLLLPALLFAQWSALYEGWNGHPRIVGGVVPTVLSAGISYQSRGKTSLSALSTFGYTERMLYQDPVTGKLSGDVLIYDVVQASSLAAVTQSFGVHHLSLGVQGTFERALDSLMVGKADLPSGKVNPLSTWSANSIYGNLTGLQGKAFFHYRFGEISGMPISGAGALGDLHLAYSFGTHSLSATAALLGMTTLHHTTEGKQSLFAISFADRISASYIHGDTITLLEQEETTLGEKVRGFGTYQYPLTFSIANQAELRFSGPELLGSAIFPRFVIFVDVGYGVGEVANATAAGISQRLLASAGGTLVFTIGPWMDFGYQVAYLIAGENPAYPQAKIVGQLMAHLRF